MQNPKRKSARHTSAVPNDKPYNLRCQIPPELKAAVKEQATRERRDITAVVILALEQYLARNPLPSPPDTNSK
jgi:hypothetical protein